MRDAPGSGTPDHSRAAPAVNANENRSQKSLCSDRAAAAMLRGMNAMRNAVDYEAVLRDAGLRITKPRRIILEILHDTEGHPDATQIFERAVAMDSRISLATVYRTMKALEEIGRDPAPRLRRRPGAVRGADGAPRPPDRPRHRRGDRVRLRPDRGAAGGDRGAARLRDRAPPAGALRAQAQGASCRPSGSAERARAAPRCSRSARRRARTGTPSARVKVDAALPLAAQRGGELGVERQPRLAAGRAAGAPGERHAAARRRSPATRPSGR